MSEAAHRPWTVDEFLAWERGQDDRHEYVDLMIRMMVGGSIGHNTITGNLHGLLFQGLRGDPGGAACRVMSQGAKVVALGNVMYPDVVATRAPQDPATDIVNEPALIVEVLSKSTAAFDRGGKWRAYQSIPSLADFCLVSQDEALVEHYSRKPGGWDFRLLAGLDAELALSGLALRLPLRDIYAGSAVPSA